MSPSRSSDDRKPAASNTTSSGTQQQQQQQRQPQQQRQQQQLSQPTAPASSSQAAAAAAAAAAASFRYYAFDETKLQQLRSEAPWTQSPKYFTKVAISPSAIITMMTHCQSGVDKGRSRSTSMTTTMTSSSSTSTFTTGGGGVGGGNPIEVMGLLLGRPDPVATTTLVVTDAFPLPIEGFETRVVADDESVVNHMIELGEALELSRKERFMGWYHSHPFDLKEDGSSHCFLSQTDLTTQLQWQRAEDGHGNPFCAIVVDPLLSLHVGTPQLKAFRAYPPEYASPTRNECPDGSIQHNEQVRLEVWGSCWNRYYELPIEYFMSSSARHVLEQLTRDYLWMRTLTTSPHTQSIITSGSNNSNNNSGGGTAATATTTTTTTTSHSSSQVVGATGAAIRAPEMMNIAQTMERVVTEVNLMQRQVRSDVGSGAMLSSSGAGGGGRTGSGGGGGGGGGFGWTSSSSSTGAGATGGGSTAASASGGGATGGGGGTTTGTAHKNPVDELHQATRQLTNVATDQLQDLTLQWTKRQVFGGAETHSII